MAVSTSRRLVAIMFTDIQGYTALMQEDEAQAIVLRNRHREVFNRLHEQYEGEILNYYGDGTLSIFNSSVHAVQCGVDIQRELQQDPPVPLRVGIHVGDIVITEDDIIGDSVNIASRIENLGIPGCVLISETVNHQIKNHSIKTKQLGPVTLKNVSQPMEIYAIEVKGLNLPTYKQVVLNGEPNKSKDHSSSHMRFLSKWLIYGFVAIMVGMGIYFSVNSMNSAEFDPYEYSIAMLPMENLAEDENLTQFAFGAIEGILHNLNKINELDVTPARSAMRFRGSEKSALEIGKELGRAYLLSGSVSNLEGQMRAFVQLIDVKSDRQLWSEEYSGTGSAESQIKFQNLIAEKVATTLGISLTNEERQQINIMPTHNTKAYNYYLKGRAEGGLSSESNLRAIEYFKKAIQEDSTFTLAYIGLARAYNGRHIFHGADYSWVTDSAQMAIDRAGKFEDTGRSVLKFQILHYMALGWYREAKDMLNRIRNLVPEKELINQSYSVYVGTRNLDSIIEYTLRLADLNKERKKAEPYWAYRGIHWLLGEYDKGIAQLEKSGSPARNPFDRMLDAQIKNDLDSAFIFAQELIKQNPSRGNYYSGLISIKRKDYPSAVKFLEKRFPDGNSMLLAYAFFKQDLNEKGTDLLIKSREKHLDLIKRNQQSSDISLELAGGFAIEGNVEKAVHWLEDARQKGFIFYWEIESNPIYDQIREHPKYKLIISEMKDYVVEKRLKWEMIMKERERKK